MSEVMAEYTREDLEAAVMSAQALVIFILMTQGGKVEIPVAEVRAAILNEHAYEVRQDEEGNVVVELV